MPVDLLAILISFQIWIVVLLFAFLIWNRVAREWRERRERERTEAIVEALERVASGEAGEAEDDGVMEALGRANVRSAWEAFETRFDDLSEEDRYRLRDRIRESKWFTRVRRSVRSILWWRRVDGVQMLTYLGKRKDAPTLRKRLNDRRPVVRMATVFTARRLILPELVTPLLERATETPSARRKAYLDALLSYGDELVHTVRTRLRRSDDEEGLVTLLELAARLPERAGNTEGLAQVIVPHTTDDRMELRIRAVTALGSYDDPVVVPALHSALRDEAWQVRAKAAGALGERAAIESRDELRRALSDSHWWVRLRAGISLRQLGETGESVLSGVDAVDDPFAHDMSRYVLRLDERALTTYQARG